MNMSLYVDYPAVLKMAGCCLDTLRDWQRKNQFPRPSHRLGRKVYWRRAEVEAALAARMKPIVR